MKRQRNNQGNGQGNSHGNGQPQGPPPGTIQAHEVSLVEVNAPAVKSIHHSLPARPGFMPAAGAVSEMPVIGHRGKMSLVGHPVQEDRTVIKKANMSAAEALRAKLAGSSGVPADAEKTDEETKPDVTGEDYDQPGEEAEDGTSPRGKKRKAKNDRPVPVLTETAEDGVEALDDEDDVDEEEAPPNPDADQPLPRKAKLKAMEKLKKNPDGTVDYEDTVKYAVRFRT
jgi:5'-3' exoribonuclease 2